MPDGFFPVAQTASEPPQSKVPRCGQCGLYRHCRSPKMKFTGDGRRGILVVAEAPGAEEDKQGTQLVGPVGQFLRRELELLDVDLDRDCWKMNAINCRPAKNRKPTDAEIEHCRPLILNAIDRLKPRTIILFGAAAVRSVIGWTWRRDPGVIGKWAGWRIPDQRINAWICPTWHPSHLLRQEDEDQIHYKILLIWFRRHLAAAVGLNHRPWKTRPDWAADVNIEMDANRAAAILSGMVQYCESRPGRMLAVDYETNMLKPDAPDARIVSCAVACGDSGGPTASVSYPWVGAAIDATGRLLRSDVPKIIANKGFEIRWTLREFGHGVRNVVWDTMHDAHMLDNRPGTTGVKFQAYVLLGQAPWDERIKPYFQADNSNAKNRIGEIRLEDLLRYGGMDALVEFRLALRQAKLMGVEVCG